MAKKKLGAQLSMAWQAVRLPLALIASWLTFIVLVALAATSNSSQATNSFYLLAGFAALFSPLAYALVSNSSGVTKGPRSRSQQGYRWVVFLGLFVICFLYTLGGDTTVRLITAILLVIVAGLVLANRWTR